MNFVIKERSDCLEQLCSEINKKNKRVVLYGKGEYAKILYPQLKRNGININEVVADKAYIKEGELFEGYVVKNIADTLSDPIGSIYIVAFGAWRDYANDIKNWKSHIERLYGGGDNEVVFYDCYGRIAYDYINENMNLFVETFEWLEDEESKNVMMAFLNQRVSGKMEYINLYSVPDQYFPNDLITLGNHEVIVDDGAYVGDTIEIIEKKFKDCHIEDYKIISIEPDKENIVKIKNAYKSNPHIKLYEKGTGERKSQLKFIKDIQGWHISEKGDVLLEVDSIDNLVQSEKVSFIKMDIEGSELASLKGAYDTIKNNKPTLAICVYHKKEDLITIPQFIKSVNCDYKLYLRAHGGDSSEVVLYAI